MNYLTIKCESVNIETKHNTNGIEVSMYKPHMDFIGDIEIIELVKGFDNSRLFEAIIDNDEEVLHNYLTKSGYTFHKK